MARRDPLDFTPGGERDQFGLEALADDGGAVPAPPPIRRDDDVPAVTGEFGEPPKTPYVPEFDPAPGSKRRWLQRPSWASEPRPVTTKASGGTVVTFPPRSAPSWETAITVGGRTVDGVRSGSGRTPDLEPPEVDSGRPEPEVVPSAEPFDPMSQETSEIAPSALSGPDGVDRAVDGLSPSTGPGAHSLRPTSPEGGAGAPDLPMLFLDEGEPPGPPDRDEDPFGVVTTEISTRLPPHLMALRSVEAAEPANGGDDPGGGEDPGGGDDRADVGRSEPDPDDDIGGESELDALLAELSAVAEREEVRPEPLAEAPGPEDPPVSPASDRGAGRAGPTARSLDVDRPARRRPPLDSRAPVLKQGPRRPPARPPRSRPPGPGRSGSRASRSPSSAAPGRPPGGPPGRRPIWVRVEEEEDLGPFGRWSRPLGLGLAGFAVFAAVLILALQALG